MRRVCWHLSPLISMLVLFSTLSYGQSWSSILAPSRAIDWTHAGLPATLPDGETTPNPWTPPTRTQCGSTISSGASPATINAALAACGTGHYVLLGAGTFTFNNANLTMYAENGVTLRGSGPQSTFVDLTGSASINFGISWNNGSCTWSSGLSPGSASLTMTSCSGPSLVAGELVQLTQCDTGYSGTPCTGTSADNGGLYICGDNNACQFGSDAGNNNHQQQVVYVTSVTGTGPYTVNFTPAIYMPNWSSGNTPLVTWITSTSAGNTPTPYGNALEDMTVYTSSDTANYSVYFNNTYASWVKGVRFIGAAPNSVLLIQDTKNSLVMNNYFLADIALDGNYPSAMEQGGDSDDLILNNISSSGVPWEGMGMNSGNVVAYNYGRDTFTAYDEDNYFDHHAGSSFDLFEGIQTGIQTSDNTWGTHNLNTWFRNYSSGWDAPYQTINQRGMEFDAYQRFMNVIGNAVGPGPVLAPLSTYQSSSGNTGFIFQFDVQGNSDQIGRAH